jgi:hypothetical protein
VFVANKNKNDTGTSQLEATMSNKDRIADDIVWGVDGEDGIAAELGIPKERAYYLIAQGRIPVTRLGHRTIIASRKQLRRLTDTETP